MIDWKRLPKIDAHIHLLPEDVIDANRGCGDTFVEYGSAQDYLTLMEQYNIEQAIIEELSIDTLSSRYFRYI